MPCKDCDKQREHTRLGFAKHWEVGLTRCMFDPSYKFRSHNYECERYAPTPQRKIFLDFKRGMRREQDDSATD